MNRKKVFDIQLLSLFFIAIILVCSVVINSRQASYLLLKIVSFLIVAELIWMIYSWSKLSEGIFNPYGMFVSMTALTHASVPILILLAVEPNYSSYTYRWVSSIPIKSVINGYFLIALSCCFVHMGACFAPKNPVFMSGENVSQLSIRNVGWILVAFSTIPFIVTAKTLLTSAKSIGYLAYFQSDMVNTWLLNGSFFFPVGTFFIFASQTKYRMSKIASVGLLFIYSLTYLLIGSKSKFMLNIVSIFWLNQMIGVKINRWVLLFGTIIVLIVSPLISIARLMVDVKITDVWTLFNGIGDIVTSSLSELGIYSNIVATTVATFPDEMNFNWGRSYLNAVYFVIPNFFMPRGEHFGLDLSTVTWLAEIYYPEHVAKGMGFGTGFSFIAEAYESFGWFGIPVIMPFVGYILAYISNSTKSGKPLVLAFTASILPAILFYSRDSLYALSRNFVWYGFIPVILAYVYSKILGRKKGI